MLTPLFILAAGSFTVGVISFVLSGLIPFVADDFGTSIGLTGQVFTAYALTYGIGAPILATVTAPLDWRLLLTGSIACIGCGCAVASLSASLAMLIGAYCIMGLGSAIFLPGAAAATMVIVPLERRGTAVALVLGGSLVAMAAAGPIGMWLVTFGGWRMIFVITGVIAFANALGLAFAIPKGLARNTSSMAERFAAMRRGDVLTGLAVIGLAVCGTYVVYIYFSVVIGAGAGGGTSQISNGLLTLGIAAIIGNVAGGQFADRFGALLGQTIFYSIAGLAMIGISVVNHRAGMGQSLELVLALTAGWGFGFWGGYPSHVSRLVALAPEQAASTLSLNATAMYAGIAIGSVLGAQVLAFGNPANLGFIGGFITFLSIALLRYSTAQRRPR